MSASAPGDGSGAPPGGPPPAPTAPALIPPCGMGPVDVDAYAARCSGHGRLKRMQHIAAAALGGTSEPGHRDARKRALEIAAEALRAEGLNVVAYQEVVTALRGEPTAADADWVASAKRTGETRTAALDRELLAPATALVKETMRRAHEDMGDCLYARGELAMALNSYMRMREYCSTQAQAADALVKAIKTCFEADDIATIPGLLSKLEGYRATAEPNLPSRYSMCEGLLALRQGNFKKAARSFIDVDPAFATSLPDLISVEEIALVGGLCALSQFDRDELRSRVVDNVGFRKVLDSVPRVREMIVSFQSCKYASALSILESLKPELSWDYLLHGHVGQLAASIVERAMIQYCMPYSTVNLATMAAAFLTTVPLLEKDLRNLIVNGRVAARIDSHNKVLYARQLDQRVATYRRALAVGDEYVRDTKSLLLRVSMDRNNFVVSHPRQSGAHAAGPPSGAAGSSMAMSLLGGITNMFGFGGEYGPRGDVDDVDMLEEYYGSRDA